MAMHCPQCLTEYRDGFTECADCRVPLVPGSPAKSASVHKVDLITVLETSDPFAANLAKATLEDAGIEFVMGGDDSDERGLTGMSPMGAMASRIQVESVRADEARELLEPLIHPQPIADEENS
jgi:Putative prokaryotic signal transducing protein